MVHSTVDDKLIKQSLISAKIIAMVGVSSIKKEDSSNIVRRPSIIVMNYLQEFGYRVIPVNPSAVGKKINGEKVFEKLDSKMIECFTKIKNSDEHNIYHWRNLCYQYSIENIYKVYSSRKSYLF